MRRIRLFVLGISSFLVSLIAAFLSPGTWLNRAIATAMCTVFSFNSTMCTVDLARSSQRVVAATPPAVERTIFDGLGDLLVQRSREFDDEPSTPPVTNPQAPSFPQDPGPNTPLRRPDFDDSDTERVNPVSTPLNPNRKVQTPAITEDANIPCVSPVMTTNNVEPGKQVIIKGIPQNFVKLSVAFQAEGSEQISPSIATRLSNDDVSVFVPLHPSRGALGGNTTIFIFSNNNVCPKVNFTIAALTPSPGTTKSLFLKQQQILDKIAGIFGISRNDLINAKNLPQELIPLAAAQFVLDHPRNPNSFKAILSGTSPLLKGQSPDVSILDGIIANSNMISYLDSWNNRFIPSNSKQNEIYAATYISKILDIKQKRISTNTKSEQKISFSLIKPLQDIAKTREGLSTLCRAYDYADIAQHNPVYSYLKLALNLFLTGLSLTGAGAVPALAGSITMFVIDKATKASEFILPFNVTLQFQVTEHNLDTQNKKKGEWSDVILTNIKSKGGSFDIADMIDLILTAMDIKGYAKELRESRENIARLEKSVESSKELLDNARENYFKSMQNKQTAITNQRTGLTTEKIYDSSVKEAESNLQKATNQFQRDRSALNKARIKQIEPGKEDYLSKFTSVINELRSFIKTLFEDASNHVKNFADTEVIPIKPVEYGNVTLYKKPSDTQKFISAKVESSVISLANENIYQAVQSGSANLVISSNLGSNSACLASASQEITVNDKKPIPKPGKGKTGSSYGDPHIVTFDGYRYSFQTVGEFTLVKSTDGSFEVQVRQSPVLRSQLSLNSAVAIKSGNSRLAIYGQSLPDSDTSTPIRVDGKPFAAQGGTLPNGTIIAEQGQGSYVIQLPTGEIISVRRTQRNNLSYMDVNPSVPDVVGKYVGLLGNSNGNPGDDLQTRSGKVIETKSTYGQIAQTANSFIPGLSRVAGLVSKVENIVFDQLYKEFGNSWRISQADSLFDYKAGQNTDTFSDRGFPSSYKTLAMLSSAQIQTATNACQQAGVSPEQLEGCIFDVGFTGDTGFAQTTAEALNIVNQIKQIIPGGLPIPTRIPVPVKIPGLPF
ncbi:VWD domain-containing protein [Anabaena cylindrica UHCC 0172]|uniref:VWD domain-containing protein n=1 Tax=Anabaena cylindrica TaxID=1165 RepID=UPI002B1FF93C|nr:VWD domain-containing protein [Anabaena cylindrica]MEA5552568.1 VWD domain-containing protein [Anabaena cylindrica UHCC 0172]